MDAEAIIAGLIRGALAARGKQADSFLSTSTLRTVASAALGVHQAPAPPTSPPPPAPPPPDVSDHLLRLVSLTVSAARADGDLTLEERGLILEHARSVGAEGLVVPELQSPRPLAEIVAGIADARRGSEMYTLAYTIVRADESVAGAERIYLARLAHLLGLDAATVSRLETEAEARAGR